MAAEQLGDFPSLSAYFWGTRVCNSIETDCINRQSAHCAINALIWRFRRYDGQGSSWNVALIHILVRVSVSLIAQLRGIPNWPESTWNRRHKSYLHFANSFKNRSAKSVLPSPNYFSWWIRWWSTSHIVKLCYEGLLEEWSCSPMR